MGACKQHNMEFVEPEDAGWRGKIRVCPVRGCGEQESLRRSQMKLPGLDPGRQSRVLRVSEAALVAQAAQWGAYQGYECLQVGQDIQFPRCPSCQTRATRIVCGCGVTFAPELRSQSTTGAPDTFWGRRDAGNAWVGIEFKKSEIAPVRAEQERLIALGVSDVAWNLEMVEGILRRRFR